MNGIKADPSRYLDLPPCIATPLFYIVKYRKPITIAVALLAIGIFMALALMHGSPLHLPPLAHRIIMIGAPIAMGTPAIGIIASITQKHMNKHPHSRKFPDQVQHSLKIKVANFANLKLPTEEEATQLVEALYLHSSTYPKMRENGVKGLIDAINQLRKNSKLPPLTFDIETALETAWQQEPPSSPSSTSD